MHDLVIIRTYARVSLYYKIDGYVHILNGMVLAFYKYKILG